MKRAGFSLVELSIVLVILGLLVGGILAGKSLIHAGEIRAISTEYNRYLTAEQAFRDKYFAIPGDMSNATSFWGKAHATPSTCRTTTTTDTTTCDGNGNGAMGDFNTSSNEDFAFWKHLSNAGLIEGAYDGTGTPSGNYLTPTTANSPASKFPNSIWTVYNYNGATPNSQRFQIEYGNMFVFSTPMTSPVNNVIGSANINSEDAWNVDSKIDDGKPATGKVIALAPSTACSSGSANTDLTSTYALSTAGLNCVLFFRNLF